MKTLLNVIGMLCLNCTLLFAQQTKSIDTQASIVNWIGHAEVGSYAPAGTLSFKEGTVKFNGNNVSGAYLVIDMKSMNQSNNNLLAHLKSDDFFNVEKYPVSTISITRVADGKAYGQLTLKDKTQPLVCPVTLQTINGKTTITGAIIIDRTKYGITYNSGSFFSNLGDKAIRNTFDVAFTIVVNK